MANEVKLFKLLSVAAHQLSGVNLTKNFSSAQNITAALEPLSEAYQIVVSSRSPHTSKVKKSLLTVSAISKAIAADKALCPEDHDMLNTACSTIKEVAHALGVDADDDPEMLHLAKLTYAARAASHEDRNLSDIEDAMFEIRTAVQDLKKLPKSITKGQWVVARAPIVFYSTSAIPNVALTRPGIENFTKISNGLTFKMRARTQHGYLLHNQIVIGFNPNDQLLDKDRTAIRSKANRLLDADKRVKRTTTTHGLIAQAIDVLSARLGDYFNVLSESEPPYITMPGNKLAWVWVLPVKTGRDFVPKLASASFPVLSPESENYKERTVATTKREIKELEEQQAILEKRNQTLDDDKLILLDAMRNYVAEEEGRPKPPTQEQKAAKLADLKGQVEKDVATKCKKQIEQIEELRDILKDIAPSDKDRKNETIREIKALQKVVDAVRETVMAQYRKKYLGK